MRIRAAAQKARCQREGAEVENGAATARSTVSPRSSLAASSVNGLAPSKKTSGAARRRPRSRERALRETELTSQR